MSLNGLELESTVRYYSRKFPVTFSRAKGATIWSVDGNAYTDFLAGCGALNFGHNPDDIKSAVLGYLNEDKLVHGMDMLTEARFEFMEAFEKEILKPRALGYKLMFPGPTGANAIEAAIKLARKVSGRRNIAAFTNSFHGMTLGALSATASQFHREATTVLDNSVIRLPYDGYLGPELDTSNLIHQLVAGPGSGIEPIAAYLVETLQCEGGLHEASNSWLTNISSLAQSQKALLIVDEIQTGCGRTGPYFSFERANLMPDIVCLSKSLSGYGLPLSMLLIKPELDIWSAGEHSGTFRSNNLALVSARAAINLWCSKAFQSALTENISSLDKWCRTVNLPTRGSGMIRGIVCQTGVMATDICEALFRNHILVESCGPRGEVVKLEPPLNISKLELTSALDRLTNVITIQQSA